MSEFKSLNIYQKLALATTKIETVAKKLKINITQTNSYNAVSEGDVLKAVKPVEEELGIYSYPFARRPLIQEFVTKEVTYNNKTTEKQEIFFRIEVIYRFVNTDNPSEYVDVASYGDGVDSQDKAPGKAMTYADKYALLKAYKIETGEDPNKEASKDIKKKSDIKKDWVFDSGRFKGLTMVQASQKADFHEYITLLKESGKFVEDIQNEYDRINKFMYIGSEIKEVIV